MIPLLENEKLELKYKHGFGAWTHHLVIPNTSNIGGKWGNLKVSGYIDKLGDKKHKSCSTKKGR